MSEQASITSLIKVNPKGLRKHSFNCIQSQTPFFVWGDPGIGKSRIMQHLVESLGYHFEDIRLSQIESIDLRGLPAKETDKETGEVSVVWAKPDFLKRADKARAAGKPTAFFFDELNAGSQATMAAAYQFINDRRIGCFVLGDDDIVFAAGNLESNGGITNMMPLPLANRFRHYHMTMSAEQWIEFASTSGIHPWVVAYLSVEGNGAKLQQFNPEELMGAEEKAFATPRSWEMASKSLHAAFGNGKTPSFVKPEELDENDVFNEKEVLTMSLNDVSVLVASCVGSPIATDFGAFVKEGMGLPSAKDILEGKVKTLPKLKEMASAQYFLANSCSHGLKEMKEKANEVKSKFAPDSDEVKKVNKSLNEQIENYVRFANTEFAKELFVYAVITVMIKRYKVIPMPHIISKEVMDLINTEFQKTKTTA